MSGLVKRFSTQFSSFGTQFRITKHLKANKTDAANISVEKKPELSSKANLYQVRKCL